MRIEHSESAQVRTRFAQEARAAAQLQHPNVVQVHDYGIDRDNGQAVPFIVMELLSGEDLDQRLTRERRLTPRRCQPGGTSRTGPKCRPYRWPGPPRSKPANLFLARSDGREVVKVLDFGSHRSADPTPVRARPGPPP